jgi:hypothetical protein
LAGFWTAASWARASCSASDTHVMC